MARDYDEWESPELQSMRQKIIARIVRAITTGDRITVTIKGTRFNPRNIFKPLARRTRDRRVHVLSGAGFGLIDDYSVGWREAMKQIARIKRPHPKALSRTQMVWHHYGWSLRRLVKNDDVLIAGLKVLLPRYSGPPLTLYRGQVYGQPVGLSWTHDYEIAKKFALYGMQWADLDLKKIPRRVRRKPRLGAIVLKATLRRQIISQEICLRGKFRYGEHVIDPRGIEDLPSYQVEELDDSGHNKYCCIYEIMPDGSEVLHPSLLEEDDDDGWGPEDLCGDRYALED